MATGIPFALNRTLDIEALAGSYAAHGRVQIAGLLTKPAAEALHSELRARHDWVRVINSGEKVIELDRAAQAALGPDRGAQLDEAVYAGARAGFQYRYESIRVPDGAKERVASTDPLAAFACWLSAGEPRALLQEITGKSNIDFADAQATAYGPGDFLTAHDDVVAGKRRHAAYVFGLNPVWRAEWGGLLLFHEADGARVEGLVPGFNSLNLFRVGQAHSVSEVTRATPWRRYAITGWLRSRA